MCDEMMDRRDCKSRKKVEVDGMKEERNDDGLREEEGLK
jgi:hypothetical protein